MSAASASVTANTTKMLRAICEQKIRAREIPVEQHFLDASSTGPTDPKNFLSTLVAVVHPKGIESPAHIRAGFATDDIPVDALQKLNIVGKAVTLEHGTWNDDEHRWSVRPRTAGHITDSAVDDDGRLLVTYKLHNNRWGRIAYDRIRNGTYTDVSSLLFILPREENTFDYDCNSIALCAAGRHPETHTLAMCSHVNPEEHILVDPSISGVNATTRKLVYELFPEETTSGEGVSDSTETAAETETETETKTETETETEVEEGEEGALSPSTTEVPDQTMDDPPEPVAGVDTMETELAMNALPEPTTAPAPELVAPEPVSVPAPQKVLQDYGARFAQMVTDATVAAAPMPVGPSVGQMAVPVSTYPVNVRWRGERARRNCVW